MYFLNSYLIFSFNSLNMFNFGYLNNIHKSNCVFFLIWIQPLAPSKNVSINDFFSLSLKIFF